MKKIFDRQFYQLQNSSLSFLSSITKDDRAKFVFENFSEYELLIIREGLSKIAIVNIFNTISEYKLICIVRNFSFESFLTVLEGFSNEEIYTYRLKRLEAEINAVSDKMLLIGEKFGNCRHDTKDIVQNVRTSVCALFLSTSKVSNKEFEETNFERYLNRATKNEGQSFQEKSGKKHSFESYEDQPVKFVRQKDGIDFLIDSAKLIDKMKEIVGEEDFTIFELRTVQGYSYNKIGEMLNINPLTVGTRLFRVKAELRKDKFLIDYNEYS